MTHPENETQQKAELNVAWHYLYAQRSAMSEASVGSEHFIANAHIGHVWERCRQQISRGEDIDLLAACHGGYMSVYETLDEHVAVLTREIIEKHERLMRDGAAIYRTWLETADWAQAVSSGDCDASELHERFQEIANEFHVGEDIDSRSHDEVTREVIDDYLSDNDDRGIPVPVLGQWLRKFKYGKLVLIGGLTSNHKSTYALMCAQSAAQQGFPSMYWTLEDDDSDAAERMIVNRSEVLTLEHFEMGHKERGTREAIAEAMKMAEGSGIPLRHLDKRLGLTQFIAVLRRQVQKHKLKLVVVDFMQLIDADNPRATDTDQQRANVQALAEAAKELGIVMLAVCQLTQEATKRGEDGMAPRLGDLRGGSAISQAAFGCIMTHTPMADPKAMLPKLHPHERRLELVVRKWKRARRGAFKCIVDASHDRIYLDPHG